MFSIQIEDFIYFQRNVDCMIKYEVRHNVIDWTLLPIKKLFFKVLALLLYMYILVMLFLQ